MHIPSERVFNEMRAEAASVWFVPANQFGEIAMLVKAPTPSIKALLEGCDLCVQFGKKDHYLVVGVKISDMIDSPVLINGIQRHEEEHHALQSALAARTFPLFLYNEMDICLAWSHATITTHDAEAAEAFLGRLDQTYSGDFTAEASSVLDSFVTNVEPTQNPPDSKTIHIHELPIQIEKWTAANIHFLGTSDTFGVNIEDRNEGEVFNRAIWASLESAFPLTLHKSPSILRGENYRELIDVFSSYEYGSFLIECKDLSIFSGASHRSMERRVANTMKHSRKAIKQLTGACNALKRGDALFDANHRELSIDRDKPPHCIILLTELVHSGDWSDVVARLVKAIQNTGAFFNLLDFREFMTIVKASSGKPELIDYNLIGRCEMFCKNPDAHIRSRIVAPE